MTSAQYIVSLQYMLYHGIRSAAAFKDNNVVLGREMLVADDLEMGAIWTKPGPTGKCGKGIIIFVPELRFPQPNGLQRVRDFGIGIFEERNVNYLPASGSFGGGTGVTADDTADALIDFLWNWRLFQTSGLTFPDRALVQDRRFDGIYGLRVIAELRQERRPPARASDVAIADDGNRTVTLSVTDGSPIYYTMDGFSSPMPDNDGRMQDETAARLYAGPFAVAAGTVVLAMAWNPDIPNPGQLASKTIN